MAAQSGSVDSRKLSPQALPPGEALRYPRAGMATILDQFLRALQRGAPAETSGENNLWTLAMLEAAILSAREGRKVSINEVFPHRDATGRRRAGRCEQSTPAVGRPSTTRSRSSVSMRLIGS